MKRYLQPQVEKDLKKKMVFVAGARQVGKTTLARQILGNADGYLNWDIPEHRERILKREMPTGLLWVFDEIHKYRVWRNYLKGIYDAKDSKQQVLVTGSARLDFYRFGGDSLQGRYHFLRLHPLSVAELGIRNLEELEGLLRLGGFPEPFLAGSEIEAARWSREYRTRLVREDVASLERVVDLGTMELLVLSLPERVGSPLSLNSLREGLPSQPQDCCQLAGNPRKNVCHFSHQSFRQPEAARREKGTKALSSRLVAGSGPRRSF